MILGHLAPADLCHVTLVSKSMYTLATFPGNWRHCQVRKGQVCCEGVTSLLSIDRYARLRQLDLSSTQLSQPDCLRLFSYCLASSDLRDLNLAGVDLSEVPGDLLGQVIARLVKVNLGSINYIVSDFRGTRLTSRQCCHIFTQSLKSKTLADLNLEHVDLSQVPSDLLANSLSRLRKVNLTTTNLTTGQCQDLLSATAASTTLLDLDLKCVNLNGVSPHVLAMAVSRLETVNLGYTWLTAQHFIPLLSACNNSTTLKSVTIFAVNLSELPSQLFGTSMCRLQAVDLTRTELNGEQVSVLLEKSLQVQLLHDLDLQFVNLSQVRGTLLGQAISRLKRCNLSMTDLTIQQLEEVLPLIASSATLEEIDLANNKLTDVHPTNLLAQAVSRVRKVNLENTQLSVPQIEDLFTSITDSAALKDVSLWKVDMSQVSTDLLTNAVPLLEKVNLGYTQLTSNQVVHLMEKSLKSATLSELYLNSVDLSEVPGDLLASALTRLTYLILWKNNISVAQMTSIFTASLASTTLVGMNLLEANLEKVGLTDMPLTHLTRGES